MDDEKRCESELKEYNKSLREGSVEFRSEEFCRIIGKYGKQAEADQLLRNIEGKGK